MQLEHLTCYQLSDLSIWLDDFEKIRSRIINSYDRNSKNYTKERFNLSEQTEISVVYYKDNLICFSSMFCERKNKFFQYEPNTYRVLNRAWKDPSIRWTKPPYYILSKIMLAPQIKKAHDINAKYVFISREGKNRRWMSKWVEDANADGYNWKQLNGMAKVCGGEYKYCWQNVAIHPISTSKHNFEIITYEEWKKITHSDKI